MSSLELKGGWLRFVLVEVFFLACLFFCRYQNFPKVCIIFLLPSFCLVIYFVLCMVRLGNILVEDFFSFNYSFVPTLQLYWWMDGSAALWKCWRLREKEWRVCIFLLSFSLVSHSNNAPCDWMWEHKDITGKSQEYILHTGFFALIICKAIIIEDDTWHYARENVRKCD